MENQSEIMKSGLSSTVENEVQPSSEKPSSVKNNPTTGPTDQEELLSSSQLCEHSNPYLKSAMDIVEMYLADKRSVQMKRQLSVGVFQALDDFCNDINKNDEHTQIRNTCNALLADQMKYLHLLYQFLNEVFRALPGGIDPHLANSLLMLHSLLSSWTNNNEELAVYVVKKGFLVEHIDQLCMLKNSSMNPEIIRLLVALNLSTIYNCSQVTSLNGYFLSPEFDCIPIFKPYMTSPYFEVRLHAKFILSSLSVLLSQAEIEQLLQLSLEEHDTFLGALKDSITAVSRLVKFDMCSFSVTEALRTIKHLASNLKNCDMIIGGDIVPSLAALLISGSISEQNAGCDLIWTLLRLPTVGPKFKKELESNEISMEECVSSLSKSSNDEEVIILAESVLFSMDMNYEGTSRILKYAEACYEHAHYSECVSSCERFIKTLSSQEDVDKVKYFMGKASFHIYQKKKFQLIKQSRKELKHTAEYQELHKACCQTSDLAIALLGAALDNGFLLPKELKMLDLVMLDHITIAKGDCNRCLLCLQKRNLRKSHYFPKSLLETFSKGAAKPLDHKIFYHSNNYYGSSKSAKELYYKMFCSSCENLLSKHGETQFNPLFFSKIYDQSDPEKLTLPQNIEYGEWLYQFCIGLIFRGLAMQYNDIYINSDEVYDLFHKCRRLLGHINPQNFPHFESCPPPEEVKIAILVNPSEISSDDSQSSMSKVLTSEILNYLNIQGPLDDDVVSRPHQLHAFAVNFGMINVLVSVKPDKLNTSSECIIDPKGGSFPVPADKERGAKLPKGIWKAFQFRAVENDIKILQLPDRVVRDFRSKKIEQPSEIGQALFPVIKSQKRADEVLTRVMPSSLPEAVKIANFLPDRFLIRPSHASTSVFLPDGHKILVHQSFNLGKGIGDTIFLAVGNDEVYSLDKPYALYHHFEPGLQLHYGNFICPFTLQALESLTELKPKTVLKGTEFDIVENFRSISIIKLPEILNEKGIANCMSLLKRIQSHYGQIEIPSFDTKCSASACWYCAELCQVCMKPASFGLTARTKDDIVLRFCSQSCQIFNARNAESYLKVWEPSESIPSPQFQARCIEKTHKELLFMHMQGMLSSGQYCKVNLALCVGEGQSMYPKDKVYVVHYLRTLNEQQVLEFFLGDDLQPEEALPYGMTDITEEAIARRRSTGEVKNLIFLALSAKGYPNLQGLLQTVATL